MKCKLLNVIDSVLLFIFIVTFVSCDAIKNKTEQKNVEEVEEEIVYAVNTYKTDSSTLDEYLEFGGDVVTASSVDVLPDMAGKISKVLVSVGDIVEKEQIIAYVDASRPGMNYKASPIKAPISGRITSFTPTTGAMVSQSAPIAKISKTDDLEIKMSVAERFVSKIKENAIATITFDAYPGVLFSAKVFEISPVIDTSTRTMSVKLRITPADDRIKVGMYARIRLVTESIKNAIVIPSSCILTRNGEYFVFVVAGTSTVRLQKIEQGITVDNKTEIISGLSVGDEVVSKGQTLLNDGDKINIISSVGASK